MPQFVIMEACMRGERFPFELVSDREHAERCQLSSPVLIVKREACWTYLH